MGRCVLGFEHTSCDLVRRGAGKPWSAACPSIGRAIAVTGFEAGWIALMVAVYARTHSTVWMSAALFVVIATSGLVAPVAGALGDRVPVTGRRAPRPR